MQIDLVDLREKIDAVATCAGGVLSLWTVLVHSVNEDIRLPGDHAIASCLFPLDVLVCCLFARVRGSGFGALIPVRDRKQVVRSAGSKRKGSKGSKGSKSGSRTTEEIAADRASSLDHRYHRSSIGDDKSIPN